MRRSKAAMMDGKTALKAACGFFEPLLVVLFVFLLLLLRLRLLCRVRWSMPPSAGLVHPSQKHVCQIIQIPPNRGMGATKALLVDVESLANKGLSLRLASHLVHHHPEIVEARGHKRGSFLSTFLSCWQDQGYRNRPRVETLCFCTWPQEPAIGLENKGGFIDKM